MGIMARPHLKAFEIEEFFIPVESEYQKTCRRKDAAIGIVPYIQSGDAIPRRQAGMIPISLSFFPCIRENIPCILSLANTEMNDPIAMPITQ